MLINLPDKLALLIGNRTPQKDGQELIGFVQIATPDGDALPVFRSVEHAEKFLKQRKRALEKSDFEIEVYSSLDFRPIADNTLKQGINLVLFKENEFGEIVAEAVLKPGSKLPPSVPDGQHRHGWGEWTPHKKP